MISFFSFVNAKDVYVKGLCRRTKNVANQLLSLIRTSIKVTHYACHHMTLINGTIPHSQLGPGLGDLNGGAEDCPQRFY